MNALKIQARQGSIYNWQTPTLRGWKENTNTNISGLRKLFVLGAIFYDGSALASQQYEAKA